MRRRAILPTINPKHFTIQAFTNFINLENPRLKNSLNGYFLTRRALKGLHPTNSYKLLKASGCSSPKVGAIAPIAVLSFTKICRDVNLKGGQRAVVKLFRRKR
jgi:hypothetical protein